MPPATATSEASETRPDGMPARIDAMMTSRFEVITGGPVNSRASAMLVRAAEAAGISRPLFLRVLEAPDPNAYSNGGSVVYITTGAVLRANDAQLFMLLAHELAHLKAGNLHLTQAQKSTIRTANEVDRRAAAYIDGVLELEDGKNRCDPDTEKTENFFPNDSETSGEVEIGNPLEEMAGDFMGSAICHAVLVGLPALAQIGSAVTRLDAFERLVNLESEMDAQAFRWGVLEGFDSEELISSFELLGDRRQLHSFLQGRFARLSSSLGAADGAAVPVGRAPVELGAQLSSDAVKTLEVIGKREGVTLEKLFGRLRRFAEAVAPIYGDQPEFRRAYHVHLIAYGAVIGVEPGLLQTAVRGLQKADLEAGGDWLGTVWFGCRYLRISSTIAGRLQSIRNRENRTLAEELRRLMIDSRYAQEGNACA